MSSALRRVAEMPLLQRRPSRSVALLSRVLASALLAAIALLPSSAAFAQAGALKEGTEKWYLERGKSNMEIGNYKAAIEAYQKATQLNPNNREAMKQLGLAYEKQGLTTDAIKQFDRYLERFKDDPDIAFKQADYLGWSRLRLPARGRDQVLQDGPRGARGRRAPPQARAAARPRAKAARRGDRAVPQAAEFEVGQGRMARRVPQAPGMGRQVPRRGDSRVSPPGRAEEGRLRDRPHARERCSRARIPRARRC